MTVLLSVASVWVESSNLKLPKDIIYWDFLCKAVKHKYGEKSIASADCS